MSIVQRFPSVVSSMLVTATVVLAVTMCGCSKKGGYNGPTGTVSGTVTINGQPCGKGNINFINENISVHGAAILQSDGTYALKVGTSFSVPVGDYRVAIVGDDPSAPPPDPSALMSNPEKFKSNDSIPPKYRDPKTSGLLVVVKEGANPNTNFDLK